jgi:hypothetical protein
VVPIVLTVTRTGKSTNILSRKQEIMSYVSPSSIHYASDLLREEAKKLRKQSDPFSMAGVWSKAKDLEILAVYIEESDAILNVRS